MTLDAKLAAALALTSSLLVACDWSAVTFSGTIRVSADIAPSEVAPILLLMNDDDRYPLGTLPDDWAPEDWITTAGSPGVIVPAGRMSGTTGTYDGIVFQPGQLEYFFWHSELEYAATQVYLGAFLDLNDNGQLDRTEPWGRFASNPLLDPVTDDHDEAPNEADILIDSVYLSTPPDEESSS